MYTYLNTDKNRELSKLLHEKGCTSQNGQNWFADNDPDDWFLTRKVANKSTGVEWSHPAFTFEDCIRRENAIILWDKPHYESNTLLLMYQTDQDWQTYIINHLKGEHNV